MKPIKPYIILALGPDTLHYITSKATEAEADEWIATKSHDHNTWYITEHISDLDIRDIVFEEHDKHLIPLAKKLKREYEEDEFYLTPKEREELGDEYDPDKLHAKNAYIPGLSDEEEACEESHDLSTRAGIQAMDFHNACGDR